MTLFEINLLVYLLVWGALLQFSFAAYILEAWNIVWIGIGEVYQRPHKTEPWDFCNDTTYRQHHRKIGEIARARLMVALSEKTPEAK